MDDCDPSSSAMVGDLVKNVDNLGPDLDSGLLAGAALSDNGLNLAMPRSESMEVCESP